MPSTFTHGVVPASCLALTSASNQKIPKKQLLRLAAIGCFLGNSPDLDIIPGTLWASHFAEIHRNWGHNIFSLVLFTWVGTLLFKYFIEAPYRPKRIWLTSALLVLSHVLFDSMGHEGADGLRHGVPLFWPVNNFEFIAPVTVFLSYTVDPKYPPLLAHILSPSFWTRAVFMEVFFTVCFVPVWVCSYIAVRRLVNRKGKLVEPIAVEEENYPSKSAAN